MREIKYRGKRVDNGEWVYGYYWFNHMGNHFIRETINKNGAIGIVDYEVLPETVGQFTGQKDAHNEEIFEDDLLEDCDDVYTVEWNNDDAMFSLICDNISLDFGDCNGEWYEKIGNIHDNPELLEVKE